MTKELAMLNKILAKLAPETLGLALAMLATRGKTMTQMDLLRAVQGFVD